MNGRWTLVPRGATRRGPALARPARVAATRRVQWNGPVLELHARGIPRLGPDVLERPPRPRRDGAHLRRGDRGRAVGDAMLDQRLVAGIGNKWKAEALWESQRLAVAAARRDERTSSSTPCFGAAAGLMRGSLDGRRARNRVYRLVGRPCPRCGERIRLARPGRRQPDRLLVPGLPALIRRVGTPVHRPWAVPEPVSAQVIEIDRRTPSG